jgi:transmembrane sensor
MMSDQRLKYLFELYTNGECTVLEERELFALALASKNEIEVEGLLDEYWERQKIEFLMPEENALLMAEKILQTQMEEDRKVRKLNWKKIAIAASVLLLVGLGNYFSFFNNKKQASIQLASEEERFKDGLKPGSDGAILRITNGQSINLDTAADGTLVMQSNTLVRKLNNELVYQPENGAKNKKDVVINTLETKRGNKYKLTLADGTNVWLDAASSITFPSMFIGDERKVSITGQVYFEVKEDKAHPFMVDVAGKGTIEVLGTKFNVNAYDNDGIIKTTLLGGSVKMRSTGTQETAILKPGEQSQLSNNSLSVVGGVNLNEVMAWKNGFFVFNDADITTIMRQVERWYDVDVVFEYKTKQVFVAEVPRDVNAADFFRILEATGWIHFRIEGKKVVVMK